MPDNEAGLTGFTVQQEDPNSLSFVDEHGGPFYACPVSQGAYQIVWQQDGYSLYDRCSAVDIHLVQASNSTTVIAY